MTRLKSTGLQLGAALKEVWLQMMGTRHIISSRNGGALVTGVVIMMIVSMFTLAYVTFTTANLARAARDERRATAFYLTEAALEWGIAKTIDAASLAGGTVSSATYTTDVNTLLGNLRPGSGATGTVVVTGGTSVVTILSTVTYKDTTQRIRVKLRLRNVGVWNNAIFAGVGASGMGINGNVDIRGSVHILGDGEPFSDLNGNGKRDGAESYTDTNGNGKYDSGEPFVDADKNGVWTPAEPFQDRSPYNGVYDPPLTAADIVADFSGTADIGNNYSSLPADLRTKIPALTKQTINGELVETLEAEVRVKHGKFCISGNATAGQPNVAGNSFKETLDGIYVSDGYGGNKGVAGVNADNGTSNPYDLGDRVKFPSLQDSFKDPATGITYSTYEDWLDSKSLVIPHNNIKPDTPSFSVSDGNGNSISWDSSTSTMTVNGIVRINSDLNLSDKGSTIYFAGSGTLYSKGSISVHGSVMPKTLFPTTDVLGVIAKGNINFATGGGESQLNAMGAWYAEGRISSAKQSQFAGTYVASYFDMGTNVPSIYQVPSLSQNLPPGMPGAEGVISATIVSWRHL